MNEWTNTSTLQQPHQQEHFSPPPCVSLVCLNTAEAIRQCGRQHREELPSLLCLQTGSECGKKLYFCRCVGVLDCNTSSRSLLICTLAVCFVPIKLQHADRRLKQINFPRQDNTDCYPNNSSEGKVEQFMLEVLEKMWRWFSLLSVNQTNKEKKKTRNRDICSKAQHSNYFFLVFWREN